MTTSKNREQILKEIYRRTKGQTASAVFLGDIRATFDHVDNDTYWDACEELVQSGYLQHTRNGFVTLTPDGHDKITSMNRPSANVYRQSINIGTAINSPIQQGDLS